MSLIISSAYNWGFVSGMAMAGAVSVWWYNRAPIYERVKASVDGDKKAHH